MDESQGNPLKVRFTDRQESTTEDRWRYDAAGVEVVLIVSNGNDRWHCAEHGEDADCVHVQPCRATQKALRHISRTLFDAFLSLERKQAQGGCVIAEGHGPR